MTTNLLTRWALACFLVSMLAWEAKAQNSPLPDFPIGNLELFERRDLSTYGRAPRVHEGYFGQFDWLMWNVGTPIKTDIGNPNLQPVVHDVGYVRTQYNSFNTGDMYAEWVHGQRGEVGYVNDHWGVLFGSFQINGNNQAFAAGDVDVVFNDFYTPVENERLDFVNGVYVPSGIVTTQQIGLLDGFVIQRVFNAPGFSADEDLDNDGVFGRFFDGNGDGTISPTDPADKLNQRFWDVDDLVRMPTNFHELSYVNTTRIWGFELMPFYRTNPTHNNGNLEFGMGFRYIKFKDRFNVDALGGFLVDDGTDTPTSGQQISMLSESFWHTTAYNNIVGPQVSARWFKKLGAWTLSTQGRYFAGFNFQNVLQRGSLGVGHQGVIDPFIGPRYVGNNINVAQAGLTFTNSTHENEFSNVVELRAQASYQITQAFSLNVGWTGIYMDGIARSSNMVAYQLPTMGILEDENRQIFITHGLTAGFQFNR